MSARRSPTCPWCGHEIEFIEIDSPVRSGFIFECPNVDCPERQDYKTREDAVSFASMPLIIQYPTIEECDRILMSSCTLLMTPHQWVHPHDIAKARGFVSDAIGYARLLLGPVVIPRTDAKMLADVIQFLADTPGPDVIGPEEAASDLRRALDYHARLIASKIPGAQLEEDTK